MQPIIYDVAVSADGFISGADGDISLFPAAGPVVDEYLARLAEYRVVLMGRATYEFGYRFGMQPGANPYGHARSIVISKSVELPEDAAVEVQRALTPEWLAEIRRAADGPIYLCGGGHLASQLLAAGQISRLRLKRAPILLGSGTPLFGPGPTPPAHRLQLESQTDYGDGLLFQEFAILP